MNIFVRLYLVVAVTLFAAKVFAQDASSTLPQPAPVTTDAGWKPHFGVLLGAASPEGDYQTGLEGGIDVGYQPYIPFGLSGSLVYSNNLGRDGNSGIDRVMLLANGTYNFGGTNNFIRHSFVGASLGPVFRNGGVFGAIGPVLGFDIPLQKEEAQALSLGAQAKYLAVTGDNEADTLTVNGVLKYWY